MAKRDMLEGGSRHEIVQLAPPYGARYDITHLHNNAAVVMLQGW